MVQLDDIWLVNAGDGFGGDALFAYAVFQRAP